MADRKHIPVAAATPKVRLMLDSGAFSAWTQKTEINFDEYVAFIRKFEHMIDVYVNLDTIPPLHRTAATIEASAAASYANLQRMKKLGLKPLPVYHAGESWHWLQRMLDDGEEYIGLSALKGLFPGAHIRALDETFTLLTDADGYPKIKTHGFGITSHRLLVRYPWTTVDSTTWSMSAGYGKVQLPQWRDGTWDYYAEPMQIVVSGRVQGCGVRKLRNHLSNGPVMRELLTRYLAEMGLTITDVRNDDAARRYEILYFYQQVEKHVKVPRFKYRINNFLRAT